MYLNDLNEKTSSITPIHFLASKINNSNFKLTLNLFINNTKIYMYTFFLKLY